MQKRMKKVIFLFITASLLCLAGCSKKVELAEGNCYLCASGSDYTAGIRILDARGEEILELPNARMEHLVLPDGTLLNQTAGQIPENARMFVSFRKDDESYFIGVREAGAEEWILEPSEGTLAYASRDGRMLYFSINDQMYDLDFQPMEQVEEETFAVTEELVLENKYDEDGYHYISTADGSCYLDGLAFYEKNYEKNPNMTPQRGITLEKVVSETYLVVGYQHILDVVDGVTHATQYTYLCDLDGEIQHPKWDYEWVIYAEDPFDQVDRRYLVFGNSREEPFHYLDLSTGEEVALPEGYESVQYAGNGRFLMRNGTGYTIYDSVLEKTGASFTAEAAWTVYALGTDSYVIQKPRDNVVVIEGTEQYLDASTEIAVVVPGEYPVVKTGEMFGSYDASYILDEEGKLVLSSRKNILCADSAYYLILENGKYTIAAY